MKMKRIIKEVKIEKYRYIFGYTLYLNKVFPKMDIYVENVQRAWIGKNECTYEGKRDLFSHYVFYGAKSFPSNSNTVKELFKKLRLDINIDIPETIEKEFEGIIILYKLNDFNEF